MNTQKALSKVIVSYLSFIIYHSSNKYYMKSIKKIGLVTNNTKNRTKNEKNINIIINFSL